MGSYHATYFAYGLQIPDTEPDAIDSGLKGHSVGDVGHLHAGDYDADNTFLVTRCSLVGPGNYEVVTPQTATAEQMAAWNAQLRQAVTALGYDDAPDLMEPGWLVIPDLS